MARYPLRPRFRGLAWGSMGLGGALTALSFWAPPVVLVSGVTGLVLGAGYLLSPTWRLAVVTSDEGLTVEGPRGPRLSLRWDEIKNVIASPTTKTCFVDGGAADRRLMVPGDGAPAPYWIERRDALYDEVLTRVAKDRIETVPLISDRMG
ncbi:MAG: hypothetical protein IPI49_04380 [Myxococcales bacterium]|nr:hypothetical protein [Myxococcales bacterium]